MVVLGFVFSNNESPTYSVGLVSDSSGFFQRVHQALLESDSVNVKVAQRIDLSRDFRHGDIALIIETHSEEKLSYSYDRNNPDALVARNFVNDQIQNRLGRKDVAATSDEIVVVPGGRYVDFLIPGLIGFSIMLSSLFGTGMTLVSNRRANLLKRYLATPISPKEYILSHIIARCLILVAEVGMILTLGYLIFGFRIQGSWLLFAITCLLTMGLFTALAFLIGARTKDVGFYSGVANMIVLPMILLSGTWFSTNRFPSWFENLAQLLPLTPAVKSLRGISLEGSDIWSLQMPLMVLTAYFFVLTFVSQKKFSWY